MGLNDKTVGLWMQALTADKNPLEQDSGPMERRWCDKVNKKKYLDLRLGIKKPKFRYRLEYFYNYNKLQNILHFVSKWKMHNLWQNQYSNKQRTCQIDTH